MTSRKTYFVTVDTEDIREISLPENGIEYEINATPEEVKAIKMLFMKKNKNEKDAVKYLGKPFDEWGADTERNNYDAHIIAIYDKLYELGTNETKNKIKELHLL
ncbi:hypothetical protein WMZ97_02310 [Lentibacillus sp. N15]|uniref:hypothetical protein n=1 Tax=Lentibacillus songyuanensis TaxID=3136161 RepID=UPI0031BBB803